MRKISVLLGVLLVMTGLLTNHIFGYDKDVDVSDHDIAMMHAEKVYDVRNNYDDFEVVVCDDTDDERIHYQCYGDEKLLCDNYIYRDIAYDCLTGQYDDIHD